VQRQLTQSRCEVNKNNSTRKQKISSCSTEGQEPNIKKFNQSEAKIGARTLKVEQQANTLQRIKQPTVGKIPRAKEASGQPRLLILSMQRMILYLRCAKYCKPRQIAKIKTNQTNHITFSQTNFSTYSDRQECDEEVKDASTC